MLARYLRRGTPTRYAIHTPQTLATVPFGMQLLTRLRNLPQLLRTASDPAQDDYYHLSPGHTVEHLGQYLPPHHMALLGHLLGDLHQTGHPGGMHPILDLLHRDNDVPTPRFVGHAGGAQYPQSSVDVLRAFLHHLDREQDKAAAHPHSALRQYTPDFLERSGRDLLGDVDSHRRRAFPYFPMLHPDLGGGLHHLPGLYDQARDARDYGDMNQLYSLMEQLHTTALDQTRQGRQGRERQSLAGG